MPRIMFVSEEALRQLSVYDGGFVFCCVRRDFLNDHEFSRDPKLFSVVRLVRIMLFPSRLSGIAGTYELAPNTVLTNPLLELNMGLDRNTLGQNHKFSMYLTSLNSRILGPLDLDWQGHGEDRKAILPKEIPIELASHAKLVRLTSVGSDGM